MVKQKRIILTIIVFIGLALLMVLGTLYDLQISKALTNFSGGKYYSNDHVANVLECVTEFPVFIILGLAVAVRGYSSYLRNKAYRIPFVGLFTIAVFAIYYFAIQRVVDRLSVIYNFQEDLDNNLTIILYSLTSILLIGCTIFMGVKLGEKKIQKFISLSKAIIWIIAITFLLTQILKFALARPRFRTLYVIDNFDEFIPWYKSGLLKNYADKYEGWALPSDAFKSFPSGHTSFVSVLIISLYLPKFFEGISFKAYVNTLVISCLYIVLVAFSRIVAGAHYLTDVVMGFALCYITTIITVAIIFKKHKPFVESIFEEE